MSASTSSASRVPGPLERPCLPLTPGPVWMAAMPPVHRYTRHPRRSRNHGPHRPRCGPPRGSRPRSRQRRACASSRTCPSWPPRASAGSRSSPWQAILGELMGERGRLGVAVAGTHGKSTATALLGHLLVAAGHDPTVEVGALIPGLGRLGAVRWGTGVRRRGRRVRRQLPPPPPVGRPADHRSRWTTPTSSPTRTRCTTCSSAS